MPAEAKQVATQELERLQQTPPAAAEYGVSRNYLDWILALPWEKQTEDKLDLSEAARIRTNTSPGPARGSATSFTRRWSMPIASSTAAFMLPPPAPRSLNRTPRKCQVADAPAGGRVNPYATDTADRRRVLAGDLSEDRVAALPFVLAWCGLAASPCC
jgi:hypothetical protein